MECQRQDKEELFAFYDFPAAYLDAHQDDQPHRVDLRDGEVAHEGDQGMRLTNGDVDGGVQAGSGRGENPEAANGAQTDRARYARANVRGRRTSGSRLK